MLELLQFPFVQRALIGGVVAAILLGWIGVYITSKQMSFVGDGVAHASLAAIALAVLLGWSPTIVALIFSVIFGIVLYYLDAKTSISRDMAIGILFSAGIALGLVILQFHQGYVPELMSFLFGNILTINNIDLLAIAIVGIVLIGVLWWFRQELLFITVDPDGAYLSGVNRSFVELLLYVFTSLSVVLSIKIVGIVLVTALLVLPSAIAKSFSSSFKAFLFHAVWLSVLIVVIGLLFSLYSNWPSGASIVLVGTFLFLLSKLFIRSS